MNHPRLNPLAQQRATPQALSLGALVKRPASFALRFMVMLACGVMVVFGSQPDSPEALASDLASPWSVLTVSEMIDQRCVAPVYFGIRIRRSESGITIAPWQEEHEKQMDGIARKVTEAELKTLLESIRHHYDAAIASLDIYERIAALATEEERKKAREEIKKAAGGVPIGMSGRDGIDIRIQGAGMTDRRYGNNYGATGLHEFQKWLESLGMKGL